MLINNLVDLSMVSSVESNVSSHSDTDSTTSTVKTLHASSASTRITIHGYISSTTASSSDSASHSHRRNNSSKSTDAPARKEVVLLVLHPQSHSLASEWLDGLLMLLNQQPITAETNTLISLASNYGLKIRLLNVRFDDQASPGEEPELPSREGLDEDYYYDVFGGS